MSDAFQIRILISSFQNQNYCHQISSRFVFIYVVVVEQREWMEEESNINHFEKKKYELSSSNTHLFDRELKLKKKNILIMKNYNLKKIYGKIVNE